MGATESLSGSWTGRYDYAALSSGAPVSFDAVLIETAGILRGEIVEPNAFRHEATDTLLAVLLRTRTDSRVHFIKTYTDFDADDHPVYEGKINATATWITGRWHFPRHPGVSGTFLLARTAQAAARKPTKAAEARVFEEN